MDRIIPLRRFASWVIDRLVFFAAGAAVLFVIREIDGRLGISGPQSVSFDVYDFFAIQMPLAVVITYAVWLFIIIKFGPPGRRLTNTEVRAYRGGSAGQIRKTARAIVKILLHVSLIGLVVDAVFILRDRRERRSVCDILAGTVIASRRR